MKRKMTVQSVCLMLILALLLNLTACVNPAPPSTAPSQPTQPSASVPTTAPSEPTDPPTEPTTVPTDPPTEPPTEPTEPLVEPTCGENVPVYELTQEDIDEFYRLLDECEKMAIAGEDLDAIDAISDTLDEQFEYLQTQNSIAMIHYYSDMENKLLSNRHLDCVDMLTEANDAYIKSVRRIYLSDTPAKDMLFEDWTDEDIQMLLNYDDRMVELQQRNAEIEVAYRAATSDDVIIPLYVELVQNNNEIAKLYGYENYYVYAYELVYERDYEPAQIQQMRDYAKTYLVSVFDTSLRNFNKSFGALKPAQQQAISNFLYNDYSTSAASSYIEQYLSAMPGSLKEHYEQMISTDSLFATASGAMEGAFTTTVGDRSYCFFGPGYTNASTVIHEAGHYYASRYTDLGSIPMDLAETHSQGNEWLFIASLSDNIAAAQYSSTVDYLMYNNMAMIMICLMVDEFEEKVYTTDVSGYTAADFDAIMDSVCKQYFSLSYASNNLTDVNAYWRMVVVEQPVYYISYAVSSIAALDLYSIAEKDFASAAEIYRKLCEEPLEDGGFVENITAAGLAGPFHEEFYQEITAILKARAMELSRVKSAA